MHIQQGSRTMLRLHVLQQVVVLCVLLLLANEADAQGPVNNTLIPTVSVPCLDSVLLLPLVPGETLRSTIALPSSNITAAGVCVRLSGVATLMRLDTRTAFYEARGTFTFWWPGRNASVCAGRSDPYMPGLKQYLSRYNLYLAGSTWNSSQCCTAATPCNTTDIQIKHSPVLSSSTPPTDWARIEGYRFHWYNWTLQPYILSEDLYDSNAPSPTTAKGCEEACANIPACGSYLFIPSEQDCTFYQSTPSSEFPLLPCNDTKCQLGFRMPGSCGISAAPGISHYGYRWPEWQPGRLEPSQVPDGDSFRALWSSTGIPPALQGLPAETIAECNCRCASVGNCTGYTWLAENSTCWLHRYVQTFQDPVEDPNPGTTLGRVVTGQYMPSCDKPVYWQDVSIAHGNGTRITSWDSNPQNMTYQKCYDACAADPACQAAVFRVLNYVDFSNECYILGTVWGGLVEASGWGVFQLQRCEKIPVPRVPIRNLTSTYTWLVSHTADLLPKVYMAPMVEVLTRSNGSSLLGSTAQECFAFCRSNTGCGMAIYNPTTGSCFPAFLVGLNTSALSAVTPQQALSQQGCAQGTGCIVASRTPGSCGFIASSGVLALGKRWATWSPGPTSGSWGQSWAIEPQLQNRTVISASDCGCLCQQSSTCIGYMYLGDVRSCWLQNRVNFNGVFDEDTSHETVAARIGVPVDMVADCSKVTMFTTPDSVQVALGTARIQRASNPFPVRTAAECNAACLMEPFCLAYVIANATAPVTDCMLYSSMTAGGSTYFYGGAFGTVARCPFVQAPVPTPRTLPPAPVAPAPTPAPSPEQGEAKSKSTTALGVGLGVGLGVATVIATVAALFWLRRRPRREADEAAQAEKAHIDKGPIEFTGQARNPDQHSETGIATKEISLSVPGFAPLASLFSSNDQRSRSRPGALDATKASPRPSNAGIVLSGLGGEQLSKLQASDSGPGSADGYRLKTTFTPAGASLAIRTPTSQPGHISARDLAAASGMLHGDPFIMSVSQLYRWCPDPLTDMVAVEEGVNAGALAAAAAAGQADCAGPSTPTHVDCAGPPPVQLTMAEVQQQIEIMAHGMIDRGATAVVFKCRWPSRFGPNALLAIKCMRDPYAYHMKEMLESFAYEANVLSKFRHENIVRMYGYCLEAPVVCIILELLPGSVKDLLYGSRAAKATSMNPWAKRSAFSAAGAPEGPADSPLRATRTPRVSTQRASTSSPQMILEDPDQASFGFESSNTELPQIPPGQQVLASLDFSDSGKDPTGQQPTCFTLAASGTQGSVGLGLAATSSTEPLTPQAQAAMLDDGSLRQGSSPLSKVQQDSQRGTWHERGSTRVSAATRFSRTGAMPSRVSSGNADQVVGPPPLSATELLRLAADIAAGLAHLHAKIDGLQSEAGPSVRDSVADGARSTWGTDIMSVDEASLDMKLAMGARVVHRDLKPANVLLNSLGRAKISDFGLAREHQNTTIYTQHVGAGTLTYMAPELLSGSSMANKITDKVDIYSLGIMLWEMATRTTPWKGYSDVQIQAMVTSGQRPPTPVSGQQASMSASHVSDALLRQLPSYTSLIKGCWNPRAPRRPAAAAVHKTLLKLMEQVPKEDRSPMSSDPIKEECEHNED